MSRAAALYHLQLVDHRIDAQRRVLAAVLAQIGETEEMRTLRATLAQAEEQLHQRQKAQRAVEGELELLTTKLADVETRLYGGKIQNPKELADLQKDSASLIRRRQSLEDDDLNAMIAVDEAHNARDAARVRLAAVEQDWQRAQSRLHEEQARHEALIAATSEERALSESAVPPEDLALYRALRQRKGGLAVGVLRDGICSACGVAPSATRVSGARSEDTLVRCGNCERILYVDLDRFVADEDL